MDTGTYKPRYSKPGFAKKLAARRYLPPRPNNSTSPLLGTGDGRRLPDGSEVMTISPMAFLEK